MRRQIEKRRGECRDREWAAANGKPTAAGTGGQRARVSYSRRRRTGLGHVSAAIVVFVVAAHRRRRQFAERILELTAGRLITLHYFV